MSRFFSNSSGYTHITTVHQCYYWPTSIVLLSGVWCLSSSVTPHGESAGGFTRAGQAMTSCRLQSNYSFTVILHGGPVVLHPVRATH